MANNTDIVKDLIAAEETLSDIYHSEFYIPHEDFEILVHTLQRARDALRWIPVSEKPESDEEYPQFQVYMPNVRGDKFRLGYYFKKCEPTPWSVNGLSRLQATAEITHYRPVPTLPEEENGE